MESNETSKYQKLAFLLLDPIIKQLLRCQEELNSITSNLALKEPSNISSISSNVVDENVSRMISLNKRQVDLFCSLKDLLGNLSGRDNDGKPEAARIIHGDESNHVTYAFFEMEKYITLPIILCLQHINQWQSQQENHVNNFMKAQDSMKNLKVIQSSALRNAIESAASCLTQFVRILCKEGFPDTNGATKNDSTSCLMSMDIRMKCVITVSTTLTLVLESLNAIVKDRTNNREEDTKLFDLSSRSNQQSQLDKGDVCLGALLGSLYALLSTASNEKFFVEKLCSYLPNNGLVFGIIQNCIHCLDYDSSGTKGKDSDVQSTNTFSRETTLDKSVRGNVQLQLDSLRVLEALLEMAHETRHDERDQMVDCFQHAFPTCFGVLFRYTHLHFRCSTSLSSSKLSVQLIASLSVLIIKALANYTTERLRESNTPVRMNSEETLCINASSTDQSATKLLNAARMMKTSKTLTDTSTEKNQNSTSNRINESERAFIEQVRRRIPIPLSILFKLIPSQKSVHVRKASVLLLCKAILVDTFETWTVDVSNIDDDLSNSLKLIRDSAFECLMILLDDSHTEVSEASDKVLQLYQSVLKKSEGMGDTDHHQIMITNIMECIQSLPTIARSRKEYDLRLKMKLICGYISVIANTRHNTKGNIYLVKKLIKNPFKKCLVDIFILDDCVTKNTIVSDVSNIPQFMYMLDDNTIDVAKRMLRRVAQLLGTKLSMIFADECIADLYESISSRLQHDGAATYDLNHFMWVQQHFGLITMSVELIHGLKFLDLTKHQMNSLNAFSLSILPILFSAHFWQLPTTSAWASSKNVKLKNENHHTNPFKSQRYDILSTSNLIDNAASSGEQKNILFSDISFSALYGNSLIQCGFIDIIENLRVLIPTHFEQYMTTLLYPLLQKTSDINCSSVQQHALSALQNIALTCGFTSIEKLLSYHLRYIIEVFTSHLQGTILVQTEKQFYQQSHSFYTLQSVMKFLKQPGSLEVSLQDTNRESRDECESKAMLVVDMMKTLNDWFVKNFKKGVNDLVSFIVVPMGMLDVFTTCIEFIQSKFHHIKKKQRKPDNDFHFMNLLRQFEVGDCISAVDSFVNTDQSSLTSASNEDIFSSDTFKEMINVIQNVLLTISVYLSIPDLKIQRMSCKFFNDAFRLLSKVQIHCKLVDIDVGNPLLETVNMYWHPLQKRFQSTSESLCQRTRKEPARMHLILLQNSLLQTISILSQLCDGFLSQRFQNTIFPYMSKILHLYTYQSKDGGILQSVPLKEDEELLSPLLDCIQKVFSVEGSNLLAMVGLVGSIILPFVSVNGKIGESAMEAMKTLLAVDSDCMWRALMRGSESDIPQRPLLPHITLEVKNRSSAVADSTSTFSECCSQLMNFADGLPEQNIVA